MELRHDGFQHGLQTDEGVLQAVHGGTAIGIGLLFDRQPVGIADFTGGLQDGRPWNGILSENGLLHALVFFDDGRLDVESAGTARLFADESRGILPRDI